LRQGRLEDAGLLAGSGPRSITDREFGLFQALIQREAGIHLSPAKKALVVGRLGKRLRALGMPTFEAYYVHLLQGDADERVRMLDAICTNETHFFREPRHFELLEREVLPAWAREAEAGRRPRRVRAWSAGCSTGEEPYSLAMVLRRFFPFSSGWEIEVLATDLSTRVLSAARSAIWPLEKAREIPPRYLRAFMLQGTRSQHGLMKAGPEIRSLVRFERLNLNLDAYPVPGGFDLVFCRNVLIYFNREAKAQAVARLVGHIADEGFLFVGHAETLSGIVEGVRSVGPNVYARAGGAPARDARRAKVG
jgi:chemotaxis protein methyltransferase CheR